MALAQVERVRGLLAGLVGGVEVVGVRTAGDRWQGDLSELGGKGAFLKEIDGKLLAGEIDVAVHCLKDVPGDVPLPEGTMFAAYLERDDVHDIILFRDKTKKLPQGATVATSSVRRTAQLLKARPDLTIKKLRGNVNSRLARLDEGREFDAMVVANAGLQRIGETRPGRILPLDLMCPAVGAGVIALQCRQDDEDTAKTLRHLDDAPTRTHVTAERAMLRDLQGHCNSPIAGHCRTENGRLTLTGMVFTPDGTGFAEAREMGDDPEELGARVAAELIRQGARKIIARTAP